MDQERNLEFVDGFTVSDEVFMLLGLDFGGSYASSENVTIVGNSKVWQQVPAGEKFDWSQEGF